jgi:selenide,water dikinase
VGILTTAEKRGLLEPEHVHVARDCMTRLNKVGAEFGKLPQVTAMTDVTGFGLLGHLVEMADGSGLTAELDAAAVPMLPGVAQYLGAGCIPGGTLRNFDSYGGRISALTDDQKHVLCDPQTSGGLLVAVTPEGDAGFRAVAAEAGLTLVPIGRLVTQQSQAVVVR